MKIQRFVVVSMLLLLLACNVNSEKQEVATSSEISHENDHFKDPIPQDPGQANQREHREKEPEKQNQNLPDTKIAWDKKLVKKAELLLEVANARKYRQLMGDWVRAAGGYVSKEEQLQKDNKIADQVTIKVPVDQFETLLSDITADSVTVISRTINTEDVTGEYVDIRSRLESKKQVRLRYLDFLKQAKNMEEVLSVQKEVNDLQEEMESAAGRITYLSQASAFSTIILSFYEIDALPVPKDEYPGYLTRLVDSVKIGASWVGELFLILFSIWPFFAIIGMVLIWYRRKAKKSVERKPEIS